MDSSTPKSPQSKRDRRSSQRQSIAMSTSGQRDSSAGIVETAVFDALVSDGQIRPDSTHQNHSIMPPSGSGFDSLYSTPHSMNPSAPASTSKPSSSYVAPVSNFRNFVSGGDSPSSKNPPKIDYLALGTPAVPTQIQMREIQPRVEPSIHMLTNEFSLASERPSAPQPGPSHPYTMYQQGINDVTIPEVVATIQRPVQPQLLQGPSHPYTMYPQNVDSVDNAAPTQTNIPPMVGFDPNAGYQRRIGPDGEESGLVGPFGYTEELPPYTRYPEQGHSAKNSTADSSGTAVSTESSNAGIAGPSASAANTTSENRHDAQDALNRRSADSSLSRSPQPPMSIPRTIEAQTNAPGSRPMVLPPIDGAGGIGLATRDPEFASGNDLDSPDSGPSRHSFASETSHHEINTAAKDVSEKDTPKKAWQVKAQRKIGGVVPLWALIFAGVVLLIVGVVLGAVIGTVTSKRKKNHPPNGPIDGLLRAQIVPLHSIPPDLTPLTTGVYDIPPMMANAASASCLSDTIYSQVWSCTQPNQYQIEFDKSPILDDMEYFVSMNLANNSIHSKFIWGNQPIYFPTLSPLKVISDNSEPNWGPAWWFNMTYDKVVIISQDRFPPYKPPSKMRARDPVTSAQSYDFTPTSSFTSSTSAMDDADDTETQETITFTATITADISTSTQPTPTSKQSGFGYKDGGRVPTLKEGDMAWICTWPNTRLDFMVYPNQDNSLGNGRTDKSDDSDDAPLYSASFPSPTTENDATAASQTSLPTSDSSPDVPPRFSWHENPYPKVIKITEQHIDGPKNFPTCRKVQIINGGQDAIAVLDDDGQPIKVELTDMENDGSHGPTRRSINYPNHLLNRDAFEDSNCGCSWTLS
ncbi:hypothetical protein CFIMG_006817RA [Ceratocystis fimbriata CBS 114723]|uniref:DUF7820 domain-containing protein n=1 Tax=Ceratocystis fimbriata CBS 114723 TaxID=1035309 RepID=A0A2C5WV39_9PEZI|nr:hypothetical protein CFIMG_006817RA [Ceratocystis fimbriata CBS 114723]